MVKHSFGLQFAPGIEPIQLRLNFDRLPETKDKIAKFKSYISILGSTVPEFRTRQISIDSQDIAEVESHKHDVLQCLDIVLGAMQGKLNDNFKIIPPGKKRRGRKTKAKEAVYKAILAELKTLYPGYSFNAGITTNAESNLEFRFTAPYRHWLFVPSDSTINQSYKSKK